ncbi:hypothetical protein F5Y19DRAFT_63135 [Xylariaceae sp. FL1651]|nr:hypothetical protein F5Y19DRAFT_63135 [Xylariaceae sp. FL1651]
MEQIVIPPRNHGGHSFRYTYDDEGDIRNVERMSSIQEATEYTASRSGLASRSTKSTLLWPFHNRKASESPSTPRSSRLGRFRSGSWHSRNLLRSYDDTASIDQSIVPDYVINFMRGETPESLARKKEARKWGERGVTITPRRDTLSSHLVELGNYFSSTTDLTRGIGNGSQRSDLRRHFTGWRGGVVYNTFLAFLILVIGIISLILVITRTKVFSGALAIYSGNCSMASQINIGIHVVINVFTVVLLAGANYVFQVLTSPTRREIAAAHDRKRWLDIGVTSLRNFFYVSGFRAAIGAVLLLVAIAIQVIYNAVIFSTQITPDECAVSISSSMLAIVALLNIVLVISMAIILTRSSFDPIATLGDAIRSFLRMPDHMTSNASLISKTDLQQGRWGPNEAKQYTVAKHYWLQAPSLTRWVLTISSWLIVGAPTAAALALMAQASSENVHTPLGTATPETIYHFPIPIETTQLALVAALPQLLLGILYLSTNALLTTYFLSHELSLFAVGPRSLRVSSNPAGAQTASLYLSLPRPVSWLLLAIFAALGFVLSQAVFPIVSSSALPAGQQQPNPTPGIAFNVQGLLILLALLVSLLLFIVGLGLRRTPAAVPAGDGDGGETKGNPLALRGSSCSAVISARCHPVRGEGEFWLGPVAWGVVDEGTDARPGRCAFTGNAAGHVDAGKLYA